MKENFLRRREILFRGKQADNGKWIVGSLLIDERDNCYIGVLLQPKEPTHYMTGRTNGKTLNRFIGIGFVMVEPETVGQFTGLFDKNGKKIFEGDIIRDNYGRTKVVEFYKGRYYPFISFPEFTCWNEAECEVVGNIHDNSKLSEVT